MRCLLLGVLCCALVLACSVSAQAEVTAEQQMQVDALAAQLAEVQTLYKTKKYEDAGALVGQTLTELAALRGDEPDADLVALLDPIQKRLEAAARLLAGKGIMVPGFASSSPGSPAPTGDKVSFMRQVMPILSAKCGNCHVQQMRGMFSMATFAALEEGPPAGAVVLPGKSMGSRLIEVIQSGDMPRGGAKVTEEELALLMRWIDEGAVFDGDDKSAPLGGPARPDQPALEVAQATGNETVLFVRDLAPVIIESCTGCHGGQRPRARLRLESFASLLAGGESGQIIVPGKPAESILIQRLKGDGVNRMPMGGDPFSDELIAKFETWIAEGATFDGYDPAQSLESAVQVLIAEGMTHDELATFRQDLATRNWHLGIPDDEPVEQSTEHFLLMGNASPAVMGDVAVAAEAEWVKLAKLLKVDASDPILKGKLTLFVFNRRYDYSEYGLMVEKRDIPDGSAGHWRYSIVDAYACVLPPKSEEYPLSLTLAEQIAGAHVDGIARVPKWFSRGSGRAIAAWAYPKEPLVTQWDQEAASALASAKEPSVFLDADAISGTNLALSYAFVRALMNKPADYLKLLKQLRDGTPFDQAFAAVYGADPRTLAGAPPMPAGGRRRNR